MQTVTRVVCQNPDCDEEGDSESDIGTPVARLLPPYGWVHVDRIGRFGCGPLVKKVVVCSIECLAPAVDAAFTEASQHGGI